MLKGIYDHLIDSSRYVKSSSVDLKNLHLQHRIHEGHVVVVPLKLPNRCCRITTVQTTEQATEKTRLYLEEPGFCWVSLVVVSS